jgi:hypothetical protein
LLFLTKCLKKVSLGDIMVASLADPPKMKITSKEVDELLSFINKKDTAAVEVMIMQDAPEKRPTYLLKRGAYDAPADRVHVGLPEAIMPFDSLKYGNNRLGLAKWLIDKKNPLTSRVFVNRMWQEFFGRGLVKTSGDFGMQGEMPSHPELLDWLATDFIANGWNIKRLVTQLVTSATYMQSTVVSTEKRATDPENILLARGPRTRMSVETIRDMALASSGLLVKEIGGPSVKPYQPKGIWELTTSGRGILARYVQDHEDKLYRRGLYSFIKRTVPPPVMLVFDASNRDQCEVNRLRTNTPLQALVMLNDPLVLEASRVFAEKLTQQELSTEEKILHAFRSIACRQPKEEELNLLLKYFEDEKSKFIASPEKANDFIRAGEYPHADIQDIPSLAALMQIVHTIYNMEESITKS